MWRVLHASPASYRICIFLCFWPILAHRATLIIVHLFVFDQSLQFAAAAASSWKPRTRNYKWQPARRVGHHNCPKGEIGCSNYSNFVAGCRHANNFGLFLGGRTICEAFYDSYRTVLTNCRRCSDEGNPGTCICSAFLVTFKISNDLTVFLSWFRTKAIYIA